MSQTGSSRSLAPSVAPPIIVLLPAIVALIGLVGIYNFLHKGMPNNVLGTKVCEFDTGDLREDIAHVD
jgi:hypothetical protein